MSVYLLLGANAFFISGSNKPRTDIYEWLFIYIYMNIILNSKSVQKVNMKFTNNNTQALKKC